MRRCTGRYPNNGPHVDQGNFGFGDELHSCFENSPMRPIPLLLALLAGCAPSRPLQPTEPLALDRIPVVYGFGRKHREHIDVSGAAWSTIESIFEPESDDACEERHRIRQAVAEMERIAGEQTPTHYDIGRNRFPEVSLGQMDCRDESYNTTTYLRLFQEQGLLRWHEVLVPAFRAPLVFDAHNAAQIRDRSTNVQYVVDSWFLDNGQPPYIQEVHAWLRKTPFDDEENPG